MLGTAQSHGESSRRVTDQQFRACCQIIANAEELLETLSPSTRADELDQAMVLKIVAILQSLDVGSKAVAPLQSMCSSLAVRLSSISGVTLPKSTQTTQKSEQNTASSPPSPDHSGTALQHLSSSSTTSSTTSGSAPESTPTITETDDDLKDWDLFTFLRSNLPHDDESSWWNMLYSFVARAVSTLKGTHVSG